MNLPRVEAFRMQGFLATSELLEHIPIPHVRRFRDWPMPAFDEVLDALPTNQMIGKRAERYFSWAIQQASSYHVLGEGIQLRSLGITLGEFDFLLERVGGQSAVHLELAYKFYLFDPATEGTEEQQWIGPNRNDSLHVKLTKLHDKQFPILHTEAGLAALNKLNLRREDVRQELLFLGNLFVPHDGGFPSNRMCAEAIEGYWYRFSMLPPEVLENGVFYIPERANWFIRTVIDVDWWGVEQFMVYLAECIERKRSPLVWKRTDRGDLERFFVVWW